jgi:hypothetical protein
MESLDFVFMLFEAKDQDARSTFWVDDSDWKEVD